MPADQFAVPAQHCGRGEAQVPWRQPQAQSSQDQSVRRQQLRSLDLPTQNRELVAEGENLEIALGIRAGAQDIGLIASRTNT